MVNNKTARICSHCGVSEQHQPFTHKQYCQNCWSEYQRLRWHGKLPVYEINCRACGDKQRTQDKRKIFCSRNCKDNFKNAQAAKKRLEAKPECICPHCGKSLPKSMRSNARFCSEKCRQAADNSTKKASYKIGKKQKYISRFAVIQRDGFSCYLCDRNLELKEIQLDHIVPFAQGGKHTMENIAVVCSNCNLAKGKKLISEYLK